jgi:hypothetical protein
MDQLITSITPVNPAIIHDAVSTHLRLRRISKAALLSILIPSASITLKNTTILERRLIRKALLNTQITSEVRRVSFLYHNPNTLSLYVFDHEFYNNSEIINGDVSFKDIVFNYKSNRQ